MNNNNKSEDSDEFAGVFDGIEQEIAESGLLAQLDRYRGDNTSENNQDHSYMPRSETPESGSPRVAQENSPAANEESNVKIVTRTDYHDYLPAYTRKRHQKERTESQSEKQPRSVKKWHFVWVAAGFLAFVNFSYYSLVVSLIGIVLLILLTIKAQKNTVGKVILTSLLGIAYIIQSLFYILWVNPLF